MELPLYTIVRKHLDTCCSHTKLNNEFQQFIRNEIKKLIKVRVGRVCETLKYNKEANDMPRLIETVIERCSIYYRWKEIEKVIAIPNILLHFRQYINNFLDIILVNLASHKCSNIYKQGCTYVYDLSRLLPRVPSSLHGVITGFIQSQQSPTEMVYRDKRFHYFSR